MPDPKEIYPHKVDSTIAYYNRNAEGYAQATLGVDMTPIYRRFFAHIPPSSAILDAGSGSGRDTLAFINLGYQVQAFDASAELCAISRSLTGVPTRCLRFQDLDYDNAFDGVWACASLLHVPQVDLGDAIVRLIRALRPGGALYMSFKLGQGERITEDGRMFTYMDELRLRKIFLGLPQARLEDVWISGGEGNLKGRIDWLNAIAIKQESSAGL